MRIVRHVLFHLPPSTHELWDPSHSSCKGLDHAFVERRELAAIILTFFLVNPCTKHLGLKAWIVMCFTTPWKSRRGREPEGKLCKDWHGWKGAGCRLPLGLAAGASVLEDLRSDWGGRKVREKLPHYPAASGASWPVESRRESGALGAGVGAGGGRCCCYLQQTFLSNNLEQMEGRVPLSRASISSPSASSASPRAWGGEATQQILPESFSPDKRKG